MIERVGRSVFVLSMHLTYGIRLGSWQVLARLLARKSLLVVYSVVGCCRIITIVIMV